MYMQKPKDLWALAGKYFWELSACRLGTRCEGRPLGYLPICYFVQYSPQVKPMHTGMKASHHAFPPLASQVNTVPGTKQVSVELKSAIISTEWASGRTGKQLLRKVACASVCRILHLCQHSSSWALKAPECPILIPGQRLLPENLLCTLPLQMEG